MTTAILAYTLSALSGICFVTGVAVLIGPNWKKL